MQGTSSEPGLRGGPPAGHRGSGEDSPKRPGTPPGGGDARPRQQPGPRPVPCPGSSSAARRSPPGKAHPRLRPLLPAPPPGRPVGRPLRPRPPSCPIPAPGQIRPHPPACLIPAHLPGLRNPPQPPGPAHRPRPRPPACLIPAHLPGPAHRPAPSPPLDAVDPVHLPRPRPPVHPGRSDSAHLPASSPPPPIVQAPPTCPSGQVPPIFQPRPAARVTSLSSLTDGGISCSNPRAPRMRPRGSAAAGTRKNVGYLWAWGAGGWDAWVLGALRSLEPRGRGCPRTVLGLIQASTADPPAMVQRRPGVTVQRHSRAGEEELAGLPAQCSLPLAKPPARFPST